MNIYIETYGCSNNLSESEIMSGLLARAGFCIVNSIKNADILIINTCSVKSTTEQKILYRIKELEKIKKKMIIAGCMPESVYSRLRAITEASFVSTHHITEITSAVKKVSEGKKVEFLGKAKKQKICLPKIRKNKIIDIVPISSGCLSACTYCSTKLAKGNLFSYSKEKIIEEIDAARPFCKEFWITAQDCACYGFDNDENLAELLNNITTDVKGKYFVRVGMLNPRHVLTFLPQLIEACKDKHIFKFLHLPVQSGSDKILKLMERGYSVADFRKIINAFRREIPEITIWTDVIVGFPGEDEADFSATVNLIEEIQPGFVNVSAFGSRPGTKAAQMKQINTETKKQRTRKLSEIIDNICLEANKRWINWEGIAIVDEYKPEKQNWIGRNIAYKPIVIKNNKDIKIGDTIDVKITGVERTHLNGEII